MSKKLILVGIVVLVSSTGAQAFQQDTNFDATIGNSVWRGGGQGLSASVNGVFVGLHQDGNVGRQGHADQNTIALLGQGAAAWGRRGVSGGRQTASTEGEQSQNIGRSRCGSSVNQTQQSSTSLGQAMDKSGGKGGAAGLNVGMVDLHQGTASRAGIGGQRQTVMIVQGVLIQGRPGSMGSVSQNATVNAVQSQSF